MKRKLWIDTLGEPVITTTPNGVNNAKRWGWTEAVAVPVEPCGETFSGVPCENGKPGHKLHYANGANDKARADAWDEGFCSMRGENPYRKAVQDD